MARALAETNKHRLRVNHTPKKKTPGCLIEEIWYMCTCAHRPGCEVVVYFFSGTGPTQSKVHLAIKVEDVVGRNP